MKRQYLRGYVLRAAADDDDAATESGPLRIVAATAGMKGDGLNLTMDGAQLGRFDANPVVGYGHSYWGRDSLPIGRSDKTWIDGDRLLMDVSFDQGDEFARTVERKYRDGFLNAFSIGFDVSNIDDTGTPESWELFEVSAVPLPMDPDAVVEAGRARAAAEEQLARAGKVLSKANKKLVSDAVKALQALLDAAGGTDDTDDDTTDDEGRQARKPAPGSRTDDEIEHLRADNRRLRRLAGI